jgi:hypothetical protein
MFARFNSLQAKMHKFCLAGGDDTGVIGRLHWQ